MGVEKNALHDKQDRRRAKSAANSPRTAFSDYRFIRIELVESERQEFRDLHSDGEFAAFTVQSALDEGYKISFTWADEKKSVLCTASCGDTDHVNRGLVLTARGRDAATALAVLAYKILVIAADEPWSAVEARRGGSYQDIG